MKDKQYYVKDNKFIIKYNDKEYAIPKPFDQCYFGAEPTKEMTIHNRFSDENYTQSAKLPAFAVAIYDTMQKGLDWFSRNFTKEYMTLLD